MRLYFLLVCFLPFLSTGQPVHQPDAAEIELKLRKLNFLGSVLYLAAHPDDENTNVIAWLANDRLATTAYLSLTRGDGGQNLIGSEIREWLGVIRTQELLAARRIDGGKQYFTRAIDFGYSKSAQEAFALWGKDSVMQDAVRVIRQFKPDVIITRFPPDERAGHGHHTASAMIAGEAFDLAARPEIYPHQVATFGTWQVKRLYTNTGRWWNASVNAESPGVLTLNVGTYNPLLGKSYSEISALSSSQHKSQGWGRAGLRGERLEYLEYEKGEQADSDIFDGIDTTWSRVPGGDLVERRVNEAIESFQPTKPWATVPQLLAIRSAILDLDDNVWKTRKLQETEQLIVDCLGLYVEAKADHYQGSPGERIFASLEIVNRSPVDVRVIAAAAPQLKWDSTFTTTLVNNQKLELQFGTALPDHVSYSDPYWLSNPHRTGLYTVTDEELIGRPENPPAVTGKIKVAIEGQTIDVERPLIYKWVDPVKGELWRPFEVVPPVIVNVSEDVLVFGTDEPRNIRIVVKSTSAHKQAGQLRVTAPPGWRADPATISFSLPNRGDETTTVVRIYPSKKESSGTLTVEAEVEGKRFDKSMRLIDYDHFPVQTLLYPASVKTVRIDLRKAGSVIGFIPGAGEETPAALQNMGYEVRVLADHEITPVNLDRLDAVVLGIRALNTNPRARYFMPALLNYVEEGGTLVVQYNTNQRLAVDRFSPFHLSIGRDRVTDETAEVRILAPDHPVMNMPNRIETVDFNGWVQERGLYFPADWDKAFVPILSMNDPGESPKNSSLLVAQYGKGYYVYTGLSFFRQLPEGVPGAYKLFANLVSLGAAQKEKAEVPKPRGRGAKK